MELDVASLAVGKPVVYSWGTSGFLKHPVTSELLLLEDGFNEDGQADLVHHGGPDKAVCSYPQEHYGYWSNKLGRELQAHAFGENISTRGGIESTVCIGDIFRSGEMALEVSQPRRPCWKLAQVHNQKELALWVQESGKTGWYFRVLTPGTLAPNDKLMLHRRPHPKWSIASANRLIYQKSADPLELEELLRVEALSLSWRATLEKKLTGRQPSDSARLEGNR